MSQAVRCLFRARRETRRTIAALIVACWLCGCREEQEKLNVWVALLNMENMYGTEDSLKKVFERALQFCEPMPVYQQLADIYTKSDKLRVRSPERSQA